MSQTGAALAFWETKSLHDMTLTEWELICDGCGKCCLHKCIDEQETELVVESPLKTECSNEAEQVHFTNIACHLLNTKTCACSDYQNRTTRVPGCVKLTKDNLNKIDYLPPSCSYRRLYEGRQLPNWHPLLNRGKKATMHKVGMSIRGKTVREDEVNLDFLEDYIALWPLEDLD